MKLKPWDVTYRSGGANYVLPVWTATAKAARESAESYFRDIQDSDARIIYVTKGAG